MNKKYRIVMKDKFSDSIFILSKEFLSFEDANKEKELNKDIADWIYVFDSTEIEDINNISVSYAIKHIVV